MRILIADDHDLVRDTLATYLGAQPDVEACGARDLPHALERARADGPFDVILLDLDMPGMQGLAGLGRMIEEAPDSAVAILTGSAAIAVGREALALGAKGFLPKTLPAKSVLNALRFIAAGETYAPVETLTAREVEPTASGASPLSPREQQVLDGLTAGLSNKAIASRLELSEAAVKFHVRALSRKLGARNRTHAVILAQEMGLTS